MGFEEEIGERSCRASRGERKSEKRERELVVESLPVEMRGDREREMPEKEWRRGRRENGRRGHGGEMGFEREFGETRMKEARE
ncbi:hypothetical protein TIFTF001_018789 [Ficus carica]|uniref:Uncharacterized protein n=1 Tax=Ficus carica TaxID=3494 RepID=A0AA88AC38_FICCA|nr:hypothetical protein TIFTF001_018789 [Ficus carica]